MADTIRALLPRRTSHRPGVSLPRKGTLSGPVRRDLRRASARGTRRADARAVDAVLRGVIDGDDVRLADRREVSGPWSHD